MGARARTPLVIAARSMTSSPGLRASMDKAESIVARPAVAYHEIDPFAGGLGRTNEEPKLPPSSPFNDELNEPRPARSEERRARAKAHTGATNKRTTAIGEDDNQRQQRRSIHGPLRLAANISLIRLDESLN